jgi:hypothetical protein
MHKANTRVNTGTLNIVFFSLTLLSASFCSWALSEFKYVFGFAMMFVAFGSAAAFGRNAAIWAEEKAEEESVVRGALQEARVLINGRIARETDPQQIEMMEKTVENIKQAEATINK